jgi:radical SAM-linked protein
MKDNERKFSLPMLENPRTLRVKFRKVGNLQYISHLDLQRTFSRVLVRAGLPLWYTKGFNPHIKMVFGLPLSVGCESECEMLDIRIEREMSEAEVLERLNGELTDELRALEVYPAERKFCEVAFAEYDFEILTENADEALVQRLAAALEKGPLTAVRKTKSTESEVDLREFIRSAAVSLDGTMIRIKAVLSAGEGKYLSPELVVTALRDHVGILSGDPLCERYRILRRRTLLDDGVTEFR